MGDQTFRLKLRQLREERGWSLRELADRSGVSNSYISHLENGTLTKSGKEVSPTLDVLSKLSRGFGLPLFEFLLRTGQADEELVTYVPIGRGLPSDTPRSHCDHQTILAMAKADLKSAMTSITERYALSRSERLSVVLDLTQSDVSALIGTSE